MNIISMVWQETPDRTIVMPDVGVISIPARTGWSAVAFDLPLRYYMSKLAGEADWTIDGYWEDSGYPVFHNPWGTRSASVTTVIEPTIIAALDEAQASALAA